MNGKMHKITAPIIINVDERGAEQLTPRTIVNADEECLLVIYRRPTFRQARVQFWVSLKMLIGSLRRAVAVYLRRINLAQSAISGFYVDRPKEQENDKSRSPHHGHR